jgi:serine protease Do
MRARVLLVTVLFTAAGFLILSQSLSITVDLGTSQAVAAEDTVFWVEGDSKPVTGRPDSFADLAEGLSPAVVNIQTERTTESRFGSPEDLFEEFFGRGNPHRRKKQPRFRSESTGSGFVISQEGYIVTNNHVVEGADKIAALFEDGKELDADIVGRDPKTDLALLKVKSDEKLPVAALGDSDRIRVGDWVMAIGNPFGLDHTVTVGILSAKGRNINAGPYDDFLQTDASINPGNSGGPLIDMNGRVVGINTAINAAGQGIGFAIPINMVKDLLPQLRESGTVTRGWLGVQIQRVTPALAESFGLKSAEGALISQVFEDSPAEKAKLERGDVIVEFDGKPIKTYDDLPRQVASTAPGTAVDIVVVREGNRTGLKAVLERMEQDEEIALASHREGHSTDWGFKARDLTSSLIEQLGLPEDTGGVLIEDVDPEGPAARAGMRRGDVILEVNKQEVDDVPDLERALDDSDDSLVLLLQRGDSTLYLAVDRE